MRKFIILLTVFVMFVTALPGSAYQGSTITFVQLLENSTNADKPEFNMLLAAVQAAPMILEMLSDEDASVTLLAPNDEAFAALLEEMDVTQEAFFADADRLTEILLYHILPEPTPIKEMYDLSEINPDGFKVETLNGKFSRVSEVEETIYFDEAGVVVYDIEVINGMLYMIDHVWMPKPTLAEALADEPDFSTLLAAIEAGDPVMREGLDDPAQELTIFTPTDAAFEALDMSIDDLLADTDRLDDMILYHIYAGEIYTETLGEALEANGGSVDLDMPDGTKATFTITEDGGMSVGGATVVTADILAANGVIHVLDAVMSTHAD